MLRLYMGSITIKGWNSYGLNQYSSRRRAKTTEYEQLHCAHLVTLLALAAYACNDPAELRSILKAATTCTKSVQSIEQSKPGDLNSKHPQWNSKTMNRKGKSFRQKKPYRRRTNRGYAHSYATRDNGCSRSSNPKKRHDTLLP
ncbi:hypothetical protein Trydic_g1262 [Trypoxylus dichotomus]